jgi:hypothetical protein
VVASFSPSAMAVASASVGLAALHAEAEGGVCSITCNMFTMRRFFGPPSLPSAVEDTSFSVRGWSVPILEDLVV